jgi:hypothetical protein
MTALVLEFLSYFTWQFLSYVNLTVSVRALAHQQYEIAVLTQTLAPLLAWQMIDKVSHAKHSWVGRAAVMSAGSLAALAGMYLTRTWS